MGRIAKLPLFRAAGSLQRRIRLQQTVQFFRIGAHLFRLAHRQHQQNARHGHGPLSGSVFRIIGPSPEQRLRKIRRAEAGHLPHVVQLHRVQPHHKALIEYAAFLQDFFQIIHRRTADLRAGKAAQRRRVAGDDRQPGRVQILQGIEQRRIIVLLHGAVFSGRLLLFLMERRNEVLQSLAHLLHPARIFQQRAAVPGESLHLIHQRRTQRIKAVRHFLRRKAGKHIGHGVDRIGQQIPAEGTQLFLRAVKALRTQKTVRQALVARPQQPRTGALGGGQHVLKHVFIPAHLILIAVMKTALTILGAGAGINAVLMLVHAAHDLRGIQPYVHPQRFRFRRNGGRYSLGRFFIGGHGQQLQRRGRFHRPSLHLPAGTAGKQRQRQQPDRQLLSSCAAGLLHPRRLLSYRSDQSSSSGRTRQASSTACK